MDLIFHALPLPFFTFCILFWQSKLAILMGAGYWGGWIVRGLLERSTINNNWYLKLGQACWWQSAGSLISRLPASAPLISCSVNPKFGVSSRLNGTAGTAGEDELLLKRSTHSISFKNTYKIISSLYNARSRIFLLKISMKIRVRITESGGNYDP